VGCKISNSVLGTASYVGRGTIIENAMLMGNGAWMSDAGRREAIELGDRVYGVGERLPLLCLLVLLPVAGLRGCCWRVLAPARLGLACGAGRPSHCGSSPPHFTSLVLAVRVCYGGMVEGGSVEVGASCLSLSLRSRVPPPRCPLLQATTASCGAAWWTKTRPSVTTARSSTRAA
jgi:hypothetical protein